MRICLCTFSTVLMGRYNTALKYHTALLADKEEYVSIIGYNTFKVITSDQAPNLTRLTPKVSK